jgi:hypothetical protein
MINHLPSCWETIGLNIHPRMEAAFDEDCTSRRRIIPLSLVN